jgi:hypothetical protein
LARGFGERSLIKQGKRCRTFDPESIDEDENRNGSRRIKKVGLKEEGNDARENGGRRKRIMKGELCPAGS